MSRAVRFAPLALLLLIVVALFGLATMGFGLSTSFPLSLGLLFLCGALDNISVVIRSNLTDVSYDLPLTLKTYVPNEWMSVNVRQGERRQRVAAVRASGAQYVLYQAQPNAEVVKLARAEQ